MVLNVDKKKWWWMQKKSQLDEKFNGWKFK